MSELYEILKHELNDIIKSYEERNDMSDEKKLYTIELNLDDDFASSCAYHVDDMMHTIIRNIQHAESGDETDRWVLVGIANSLSEALDECKNLQQILCKRNNREPRSLPLAW